HIVAIHAKNWTPLGTAISRLTAAKNDSASAGMPVANMWWTQTPKLMKPMATSAVTIHRYPAMGRRENTGMIIEIIPVAGTKRMYPGGGPKNKRRGWKRSVPPPAPGAKNAVPKMRSSSRSPAATVTAGTAKITMNENTSIDQT